MGNKHWSRKPHTQISSRSPSSRLFFHIYRNKKMQSILNQVSGSGMQIKVIRILCSKTAFRKKTHAWVLLAEENRFKKCKCAYIVVLFVNFHFTVLDIIKHSFLDASSENVVFVLKVQINSLLVWITKWKFKCSQRKTLKGFSKNSQISLKIFLHCKNIMSRDSDVLHKTPYIYSSDNNKFQKVTHGWGKLLLKSFTSWTLGDFRCIWICKTYGYTKHMCINQEFF